jgi:hypothetical protein
MKTHRYGDAWRLAVAMRQPYPLHSETGDVPAQDLPPPPTFSLDEAVARQSRIEGFGWGVGAAAAVAIVVAFASGQSK